MTSSTGSATREHPAGGRAGASGARVRAGASRARARARAGAGATPTVAELRRSLGVVAAFVSTADPARYSGPDAVALVDEFTHLKRLAATGEALFAARAAAAHQPEASGAPTPAHWLAGQTGESRGQAAGMLTLGEVLTGDGPLAEACRDGQLSAPAAALVAETVRVNPAAESDLVEAARRGTLRQVKDHCAKAKADARSAEDEAARTQRLYDQRCCRTGTDRDGAFCLDARLTPLDGARLKAALDAQTEVRFEMARRAGERPSHQALCADALVDLVTGTGPTGDGTTEGTATGGPSRTRPPAQVVLRVDLALLRGTGTSTGTGTGTGTTGGVCEIPGVGPVSLDTARALLGDALCTLVITDGVDVTSVCTLGRSVPHALKVALMERDRCCVVPGCDTTTQLEIDHWRIPFADGGPASLDNLARLCRHHHRLKTHKGFSLDREGDTWVWSPPQRPATGSRNDRHPTEAEPVPDQPEDDLTGPRLFSLDE